MLEDQKKQPGEAKLTLVQFDHEYQVDYDGMPIQDVPPLTSATYVPRGATALLDAIGRAINAVGGRLSNTPENEKPSKVIVAIMTDGGENASHEFKNAQITKMIKHQTEVYKWEFLFLSAGPDVFATARSYGIPVGNTILFAATSVGTKSSMAQTSGAISSFRAGETTAGSVFDDVDDDSETVKRISTSQLRN